jgi:hypothetical protein
LLVLIMFLLISIMAPVVRAAPPEPGYVPLAPLPNTTRPGPGNTEVTDFTTYIPAVFGLSIGLAGVLAVIMMIIGGIQYLSTDSISGKSEGRKQIGAALGGLLLALGAFLILQTINPKLVNFDLDITEVGVAADRANAANGPFSCSTASDAFENLDECRENCSGVCSQTYICTDTSQRILGTKTVCENQCPPPAICVEYHLNVMPCNPPNVTANCCGNGNVEETNYEKCEPPGQGTCNPTCQTVSDDAFVNNSETMRAIIQTGNVAWEPDSAGDCLTEGSRRVSAATNMSELLMQQPLTVCRHGCSTSGYLCLRGTETLRPEVLSVIHGLAAGIEGKFGPVNFTVTSLTTGDHSQGSWHYEYRAADISAPNIPYSELEANITSLGIVNRVFCENQDGRIPCSDSTVNHLHFEVL